MTLIFSVCFLKVFYIFQFSQIFLFLTSQPFTILHTHTQRFFSRLFLQIVHLLVGVAGDEKQVLYSWCDHYTDKLGKCYPVCQLIKALIWGAAGPENVYPERGVVGIEWEAPCICMKMEVLRKPSFLLSLKVGAALIQSLSLSSLFRNPFRKLVSDIW